MICPKCNEPIELSPAIKDMLEWAKDYEQFFTRSKFATQTKSRDIFQAFIKELDYICTDESISNTLNA